MSTAANTESISLPPVNLTKFGMITFLASEAMLFGGLISAYLILWISKGHQYKPEMLSDFAWPLKLTGLNTVFLLSSSATLYVGEKLVVKGKSPTLWLFLTTILGAVFVGIQYHEWSELYRDKIWFNSGTTYTSNFFTITGFHGLHVSIGVLFLAITTLMSALGRFTPHRHDFMTCVSLYWHFVDVVWIVVFFIFYILPPILG